MTIPDLDYLRETSVRLTDLYREVGQYNALAGVLIVEARDSLRLAVAELQAEIAEEVA